MKKVFVIIAVVLIAAGIAVFTVSFAASGFSFENLGNGKLVSRTYTPEGEFSSIMIHAETDDIEFARSEDGKCTVVCLEPEKLGHEVGVKDGALTVTVRDEREWVDRLTFFSKSPKITVYLPGAEYADLTIENSTGDAVIPKEFSFASISIKNTTGDVDCAASAAGAVAIATTTGDIKVGGIGAGELELSVTTGRIEVREADIRGAVSVHVGTGDAKLDGVNCESLTSDGGTGDITLKNVVAVGEMSIKRGTGDVRFESSDAGSLLVTTSTGSITGTLRTEKIFFASSSTGRVEVPQSMSGGRAELKTSTGSIRIEIG